MNHSLTVYEEQPTLIWGLLIIVGTGSATYLLGDAFFSENLFTLGYKQLLALLLIVVAFIGILKISEPRFRFELQVSGDQLEIEAWQETEKISVLRHHLPDIEELYFLPHQPPSEDEALFDFTPNYHLVIKKQEGKTERLIDLGKIQFTLRIKDIAKIMQLIRQHRPEISIDQQQADFLNL
ncbi:MAG: hypothetical protein R3211_00100 [Balneolaceae bacterium]|nr:hypothetical protein [Balneolaceae bacterium]